MTEQIYLALLFIVRDLLAAHFDKEVDFDLGDKAETPIRDIFTLIAETFASSSNDDRVEPGISQASTADESQVTLHEEHFVISELSNEMGGGGDNTAAPV